MGVYQPKYRDPKTGAMMKSKIWWMDFRLCGRRIRESTGVTRKTLAIEAEKRRKLELERSLAGLPAESKESRIRSVAEVCEAYRTRYAHGHKPKSVAWVNERLTPILRHLAGVVLPDLTEDRLRAFIVARRAEGAGSRTINMEVSILSRCIGRKRSELWPTLKPLKEPRDVGKALTPEEETRLLEASLKAESPLIGPFIRTALTTGMRAGEILGLTWGRVNLPERYITVGEAKTAAGTGRIIPMNADLYQTILAFADWHKQHCGSIDPERYVFPIRKVRGRYDNTRRMRSIRASWEMVRDAAGLSCRIHDLRHTACTKMVERGVTEFGMLAIMGHVSKSMLERYSHVRMEAKRAAVEALTLVSGRQGGAGFDGRVKEVPKVEAIQ
jgi:integrase